MLSINSTVKLFLAIDPVDMRNYAVMEVMLSPRRSVRVNFSPVAARLRTRGS